MSKTMSIDEQIHFDVFNAEEILVKEVTRILYKSNNTSMEERERAEKLKRLGFVKAAPVVEVIIDAEKERNAAALLAKLNYYRATYPQHKFIDQASVQAICKKYDLVYGDVETYIGDIPEKNQIEIINFKVKSDDLPWTMDMNMKIYGHHLHSHMNDLKNIFNGVDENVYEWEWQDSPKQTPPSSIKSFLFSEIESFLGAKKQTPRTTTGGWTGGEHLQIMAPRHMFDLRNRKVVGNEIKIKDPIVLQRVIEGYLIVSAWGLEASDELVQNPNLN